MEGKRGPHIREVVDVQSTRLASMDLVAGQVGEGAHPSFFGSITILRQNEAMTVATLFLRSVCCCEVRMRTRISGLTPLPLSSFGFVVDRRYFFLH
jgi:hypothetical protein